MNNAFTAKKSGAAYSALIVALSAATLTLFAVCKIFFGGDETNETFLVIKPFITYAFFALLVYVFTRKGGSRFAALNVKKFGLKYLWISVALLFGMFFGLGKLNLLFEEFLKSIGLTVRVPQYPLNNAAQYVLFMISSALLPAVLEEFIFRSVILNGTKSASAVGSALLVGALFALYHGNAVQLTYQFVCGFVFTLVAVFSGSVLPSVIMHFINNAAIITIYFFAPGFQPFDNAYLVVSGLAVFCVAFAFLLVTERRKLRKKSAFGKEDAKGLFLYAAVGILFFALTCVTGLFGNA